MNQEVYHIPALFSDALTALEIKPDGIYVDATYGGGGHSKGIVERLGADGHLYSFDQDEDAIKRAFKDLRFTIVYSNFCFLSNFLRYYNVDGVDGILADLGVSFHHFDDKNRGFSFRFEGALDMRMNQKAKRTAAWILENYSKEQLADIFFLYGELKNARKIATVIDNARKTAPIITVERLLEVVKPFINPRQEKKELAMLFQALRIEVNGEMDVLEKFLKQTLKSLKPGGRLVIITYHSLEDRLVKNFMRTGNVQGILEKDFFGRNLSPFKLLTSKPIVPTNEEIKNNPRSRSAKMRIAQKL